MAVRTSRRKNDEDGRRAARPPAQGRRRSQLRAEERHAGASLFRDTRGRARFGNCPRARRCAAVRVSRATVHRRTNVPPKKGKRRREACEPGLNAA